MRAMAIGNKDKILWHGKESSQIFIANTSTHPVSLQITTGNKDTLENMDGQGMVFSIPKRIFEVLQNFPITNWDKKSQNTENVHEPKILLNICLGQLKSYILILFNFYYFLFLFFLPFSVHLLKF